MNSNGIRLLVNVIILGVSFLFLFSAFQTSSMFQTTVLTAAREASNSTFTGDGYISLAIIYITFAFANWFAPVVVVWITPKYSMFCSAIFYVLFIASFLHPMNWSLYLGSLLAGVAAAVLWTAQGNYLSMNSNSSTISRNTAIFWSIFQTCLIFGNIFQYVMFRNSNGVSNDQRTIFYASFTGAGAVGTIMMLFLRTPSKAKIAPETIITEGDLELLLKKEKFSPKEAFIQSFQLMKTRSMQLLMFMFAYIGFELTFYSGVYGTSVGQTEYFGDKAKGYIGLIGIAIGFGEITSSLIFNLLPRFLKKITPDFIIIIGLLAHSISFYLIFLSLPFEASIKSTSESTYIIPRAGVIIFCGYLLGFGDSIFNTQAMSLLGDVYRGIESPSAFALFNFMKSLTSAIAFFYCTKLTIQWQLLILAITGISGTVAFIYVERQFREMVVARNIQIIDSDD